MKPPSTSLLEEIAPSLRLLLAGDTGIGKTSAQALFLETVPGQITTAPQETKDDGDEEEEKEDSTTPTDDAETPTSADDTTAAQQQQDEQDKQNGFTQGRVSTLSIPKWLATASSSSGSATSTTLETELVSAQNIVLHDFVGYGQHPNARLAMDTVEAHLTKQYQQTRSLFGPGVSPLTTIPSTVTVVVEDEKKADEEEAEKGETEDDKDNNKSGLSTPPSLLLRLLEGGAYAHTLPDACLYFILYDLKPVDLEFMKRIMHQVNLIPVLAKADTLSVNQLWRAKQRILKQLQQHNIEFFRFGYDMDELLAMVADKRAGGPPFALSTADTWSISQEDDDDDDNEEEGKSTKRRHRHDSLRHLAVAINAGEYANTNSDLSLLQALLLGPKNQMLHRAAAQKFVDRWQAELGPVAAAAAAAPPAPPSAPSSTNPESDSAGGNHHSNSHSNNQLQSHLTSNGSSGTVITIISSGPVSGAGAAAADESAPTSAASSTTTTTTTTTAATSASVVSISTAAAISPTTTTTTTGTMRPLSTAEEEVVAQVVKLSRAQSVMRRSPSIKNFHNGALVQDGPVPSVPPVNTALLNA
ncbi:Septin 4 [Actinomortierella ambigua]|nr:Septin 4 [Actinomortierella ambigua]